MKKVIVSILMIGAFALPASAKVKSKTKKSGGHVPYAMNPAIDHSHDVALSANWADQATSPDPNVNFSVDAREAAALPPSNYRTKVYTLENFTKRGSMQVTMNAPYLGQDAPSYDGADKNAYRNMRANNESEPLPANNGK